VRRPIGELIRTKVMRQQTVCTPPFAHPSKAASSSVTLARSRFIRVFSSCSVLSRLASIPPPPPKLVFHL
jgi:hypothetical protein